MFCNFGGLSEVVNDVPIIILEDIEDGARQRFTIAYELEYLLLNTKNVIEPEISYQFKMIVHKLQINGIISLNKACELLGMSIDEYNQEDNSYI